MNKTALKNLLLSVINLYIAFTGAYHVVLWIIERSIIMAALALVVTIVCGIFFFNSASALQRHATKR